MSSYRIEQPIPKNINSYILESEIEKCSFGSVYTATHKYTEEKVAIKILSKTQLQRNITEINLINNEISILKILNHKNIIKLYEVLESDSYIYIVMEHCSGKGLFDEIIKKKNLNEKEALIIFQQLIDTMIYLHNMNICHRDIKPENILFDKNNEIKLIDFGFSFCYGNQNLKINDDFGTPSYACPEMHKGEKYIPELADVWSCGVLLYTMVSGYLPFSEEDDFLNGELIIKGQFDMPKFFSVQLKDLIKHMIEPNPKKRYRFIDILVSDWFTLNNDFSLTGGINIFQINFPIDENLLNLCNAYGYDKEIIRKGLKENKYDSNTAIYRILLKKINNINIESISDLHSNQFKNYINNTDNWFEDIERIKKVKEYYIKEEKRFNLVEKQKNEFIQKQEEALRILDTVQQKYEEFKRIEEEKIMKLIEEEEKKKEMENAANASNINQNNKILIDSPISNQNYSNSDNSRITEHDKESENSQSESNSFSSSVTPYTPISIKYDNPCSPEIFSLNKKNIMKSVKNLHKQSIFKDNSNKVSCFAYLNNEKEKEFNIHDINNNIENSNILKTPIHQLKRIQSNTIIPKDLEKKLLMELQNNNNNNNNNNNINNNLNNEYNKKEYELLANAIERFKLNREKENENIRKESDNKKNEINDSNNQKEEIKNENKDNNSINYNLNENSIISDNNNLNINNEKEKNENKNNKENNDNNNSNDDEDNISSFNESDIDLREFTPNIKSNLKKTDETELNENEKNVQTNTNSYIKKRPTGLQILDLIDTRMTERKKRKEEKEKENKQNENEQNENEQNEENQNQEKGKVDIKQIPKLQLRKSKNEFNPVGLKERKKLQLYTFDLPKRENDVFYSLTERIIDVKSKKSEEENRKLLEEIEKQEKINKKLKLETEMLLQRVIRGNEKTKKLKEKKKLENQIENKQTITNTNTNINSNINTNLNINDNHKILKKKSSKESTSIHFPKRSYNFDVQSEDYLVLLEIKKERKKQEKLLKENERKLETLKNLQDTNSKVNTLKKKKKKKVHFKTVSFINTEPSQDKENDFNNENDKNEDIKDLNKNKKDDKKESNTKVINKNESNNKLKKYKTSLKSNKTENKNNINSNKDEENKNNTVPNKPENKNKVYQNKNENKINTISNKNENKNNTSSNKSENKNNINPNKSENKNNINPNKSENKNNINPNKLENKNNNNPEKIENKNNINSDKTQINSTITINSNNLKNSPNQKNLKMNNKIKNKTRQIITDLNDFTFYENNEIIKTDISKHLTQENITETFKDNKIKNPIKKQLTKQTTNIKKKDSIKFTKTNSNINNNKKEKNCLNKNPNIQSKKELTTKEKEKEYQKLILKSFTEVEEKKKNRRGSQGIGNKKYEKLRFSYKPTHNRVSSLPNAKKLIEQDDTNLKVNKHMKISSFNINDNTFPLNDFEKPKEIKSDISKYINSSKKNRQKRIEQLELKNNSLFGYCYTQTTNENISNENSLYNNSNVENLTSRTKKPIKFTFSNLKLYSVTNNHSNYVKKTKIKLSKNVNKTLNNSTILNNDLSNQKMNNSFIYQNTNKKYKKLNSKTSNESLFEPLTERSKIYSHKTHESFIEDRNIKNVPRKNDGIIDLLCISYLSLNESIKYIKNVLKNNWIYFNQTNNYTFRCNKHTTSFDIEIVEIDEDLYYYLVKIKNGNIFTEKKLIRQLFG